MNFTAIQKRLKDYKKLKATFSMDERSCFQLIILCRVEKSAREKLVSVICYIYAEGKIDAEAVTLASDFVQQVIEAIEVAKEEGEE